MEEILASIRRIIADDEAKPATAAKDVPAAAAPKPEPPKPAPAPSKPAAMTPPPSAPSPVPQAVAPKPAAPPKPEPMPAPAESNSQDDIDALLAGLDAATTEEEVRPPQPDGDVLELTDEMALPEPEPEPTPPPPLPSPVQRAPIADDIEFAQAAPPPRSSEPMRAPPPSGWGDEGQPMLSHSTVAAVESAFNSLANTVLSNNARTLEDLVKEMLRPMLKAWLDDNLPTLVERIVRQEIERVSRGR
jgi:cell pole-organizing protein PopZ